MKTMIAVSVFFLLACILLYSRGCTSASGGKEPKPPTVKPGTTTTTSSLVSSCTNQCADYSGAGEFPYIESALLEEMAEGYQRSTDDPDVTDANAVWFNLDTLKRFIWEIEKLMCDNGCTGTLGIRIYYGKYPTIDGNSRLQYPSLNDVSTGYSNLHTVFMVPTYNIDGHNSDFTISREATTRCPETLLVRSPNYKLPSNILALSPSGRNHGELCPPRCEGSYFIFE